MTITECRNRKKELKEVNTMLLFDEACECEEDEDYSDFHPNESMEEFYEHEDIDRVLEDFT